MSRRSLRYALVACMMVALSLAVAACGSSNSSSTSGSSGGGSKTVPTGKKGGSVTVLSAGDVDYMDPGQMYYTFGYQVGYSVQRSLYFFSPKDSTKEIPDIAAAAPQISGDFKTITIKIKPNIKYSPPVNRAVTSADVKYAIERAFSANVPNAYAVGYFGDIVGAPKTPTNGVKQISGITTPDPQTLVIKLSKPSAGTVYAAMVMPITMPVPKEYASRFDAKNPSTYNQNVVFTGPYMVKNNSGGQLTGWKPGKSISVIRNPNWDASTDFRPAYLDSWEVQEGNNDAAVASKRILQGQSLVQGDGAPPAQVLQQAVNSYKSQLSFSPSGGTRYIALNTKLPPFNNINVRKAVIASFDRNALRLTRGGAIVGPIAWGYLPPNFPGFKESGGLKAPSQFDYLQSDTGNAQLAASYMKKAGYPSGKYTGSEKLLTIATNADPGKKTAEVAQAQFEKLGFKLNFREVPQDTLYTKFCGVPKSDYIVCPNVGFFKDFVDGSSLLVPTFYGPSIIPANNTNWPLLNDPKVNQLVQTAQGTPPGPKRDQAWANVNLAVTADAPAVPFVWDNQPIVVSKNVNDVNDDYSNGPFMAFLSLK
ncbi:MAG TPA: ABC transporter substrate-binding protein [Solirubrobacteraceae bacterium]